MPLLLTALEVRKNLVSLLGFHDPVSDCGEPIVIIWRVERSGECVWLVGQYLPPRDVMRSGPIHSLLQGQQTALAVLCLRRGTANVVSVSHVVTDIVHPERIQAAVAVIRKRLWPSSPVTVVDLVRALTMINTSSVHAERTTT